MTSIPTSISTRADARALFDYDPKGFLLWKVRVSSRAGPGDIAGARTIDKDGYRRLIFNKRPYYAHRLIYLWHHGEMPARVDHINRDRLDSRIENLRPATFEQNAQNARGKGSRHKNVSFHQPSGLWRIQVGANGTVHTRYTKTLEQAIATAHDLRSSLHGSFAAHP